MRTKGKITSWNDEKGFGFITPNTGGKRVFIHIKAFGNRNRRPEVNQTVTFALSTDKQGRPCAVKATLAGDRLTQQSRQANGSIYIIIATFFLVLVGAAVLADRIPSLILVIYMVASLTTFIMYAEDKSAAKKGNWRTPESTLHLLSLAGGWPGALIAQQKLGHKSKKQTFRSVFWVTVMLNFSAFIWLLTPTGTATLHALVVSAI